MKLLDQMLQQPPSVLRDWLERGNCYMTQQLKAEKTRSRLHTPDICSFFGFQPQSANDLQPLKKPHHTALVWVFFVQNSLRVITLKKQVFSNKEELSDD